MGRRLASWVAGLALLPGLGWPGLAQAAWVKAETEHFIVYGDVVDFLVKDYAVRLSVFDALLRLYNPPPPKAHPQKLSVYVVRSRKDLKRVAPDIDADIAGFYRASPEGVFAIASSDGDLKDNDTLFHEYAHHYMLDHFPAAYPAWFVEGWAEYFMTADITPRGVTVGNYNKTRAQWLMGAQWLPMEEVLSKTTGETSGEKRELYYAQAWLLTHYMRSSPQRAEQMDRIMAAIASGQDPVKTFESGSGMSIAQLTAQLRRYTTIPMTQIRDFGRIAPAVTVTPLPASADDFLLERLRVTEGGRQKPDPEFVAEMRRRAARYPGDRLAELTLAQAEFVFGDPKAGEAIMARRLQAEPEDAEALTIAGYGQLRVAEREPASRAERYRTARQLFAKAYGLDKDDYRSLYGYALSRSGEPGFPTDNDVHALLEARLLAPAVQDISILAGEALLMRNDPDDARKVLGPVANDPHGGSGSRLARALLKAQTAVEAQAAISHADEDEDHAPAR
jgi:hypothetical protein